MTQLARRHTALLCALLLAGCSVAPPAPAPVDPPVVPREDALSPFEAQQRVRALVLEDQQRWLDAAWTWEVLLVLRPAHAPYRERAAALRQRIAAVVAEQWEQAQAARQRGATEQASTHYLRVLALQPDHAQAADALRAIERERNRRLYLGKPSRLTILRRGTVAPQRAPGGTAQK